jgi:pyruvate/2-oxoglutarate dehydrogenase complex dihydrolipoamide acyltransferase (E2) component
MKTVRRLLVFPLVFVTMTAGSALAGQEPHIVNPSQLSAAVAERASAEDADRAAVHDALARPEVRRIAATMGVDADRLNSAVGTLSGTDLAQAASTARQVNDRLVGGASTIVISTTTIIIALLIVILIVLVA